MAFDPCDICNDPCSIAQAALGRDTLAQAVLSLLCSINEAVAVVPEVPEAVILGAKTGAGTAVLNASWTALSFLDGEGKLKGGELVNGTDVVILGSFDGGTTTAFRVPPGETYVFPYGASGVQVAATDLSIKSGSGVNGTIGEYNVSGFY